MLLSSVLWDFSVAFDQAVADLGAGTYGEQVYVLDAGNGGMALLDTPHISDDARAAVDAARAAIADGSAEVPELDNEKDVRDLIG